MNLLTKELASKRRRKATIGTGSMNDPYAPLTSERFNAMKELAKNGIYPGIKEK